MEDRTSLRKRHLKIKQLRIFWFVMIAFLAIQCRQYRELEITRSRQMKPQEITAFHKPLEVQIGWMPYKDQKLVMTKSNEWKIIKDEDAQAAKAVPIIIIKQGEEKDSIMIDMNIDNALLGRLIKHSIMTEEPIQRPFVEYFEVSKCGKCHPANIDKGFETN